MTTFKDLIDYCLSYLAKGATESPDAKRVVLAAYRAVANKREWSYFQRLERLNTVPAQQTGTVEFDMTGGSAERLLTLTGATWPSWAASGYVRIANVDYSVQKRIDSTKLQLTEASNPGSDVAAGTAYTIAQDTYPLPADFASVVSVEWTNGITVPTYVAPEQFVMLTTLLTGPSNPSYYTIYGDRRLHGLRAIRFYPAPDQRYQINFLYNSRGAPIEVDDYHAGTAACAADSTALAGTGTAWTQQHVGTVVRLYADATQYPTGFDGLYPRAMERVVAEVTSATALVMDEAADQTLSGVKYLISDPVDIADGAMLNYLYREVDKMARMNMRSKPTGPEETREYEMALLEAMQGDAVYRGTRVAKAPSFRQRLLREYPISLTT